MENEPLIPTEQKAAEQEQQNDKKVNKLMNEEERPVVLYAGIQQRIPNNLNCPIHGGLLRDPVATGCCKHVFCRSCLASWVELQGHCPLDSRPVDLAKLAPAPPAIADKLGGLVVHCKYGLSYDPVAGSWAPAPKESEHRCPALVPLGDRHAHEDSCAYRPEIPKSPVPAGTATATDKSRRVNLDQMVADIKSNLARAEGAMADRMHLLRGQLYSLLEEQNVKRLRTGAGMAMANIKEEVEGVVASFMAKHGVVLRNLANRSEALCTEAKDAARARGSAIYDGAVQMGSQVATASSEAISRVDALAQELVEEVRMALARGVEPADACPDPPPPPPADQVPTKDSEKVGKEKEKQQQKPDDEEEAPEDVEVHETVPRDDEDWDDNPAWIPARPPTNSPVRRRVRPCYPPPPPPRTTKPSKH